MIHKFNITEVADILGVNSFTLRRWDESGVFKANRDSSTSHRYYFEDDITNFLLNNFKYFLDIAVKWSFSNKAIYVPSKFYCADSSIFKARLDMLANILKKDSSIGESFSLITSVVAEIGKNSFDHNIGQWPDIKGIFFGYCLNERKIILADRGQGILTTLKRVRPNLKNDKDALVVAFTEVITGRDPEHRGNGLKYVRKVICDTQMHLWFHSGNGAIDFSDDIDDFSAIDIERYMAGCFVMLDYKLI